VEWLGERADKELDDLAGKIEAALSPANRAKFASMDAETRRCFAQKAIEEGLVTYSIGKGGAS